MGKAEKELDVEPLSSDNDQDDLEKKLNEENPEEELVNVDGTKVKLAGKIVKQAEELKRKTMQIKIP